MEVHSEPVGPESREGLTAVLEVERQVKEESEVPVCLCPGVPLMGHSSLAPAVFTCEMSAPINGINSPSPFASVI